MVSPPTTPEEWRELMLAYRTTEGCGCCGPCDDTAESLRNGVAEMVGRPAGVPDEPAWHDKSPAAKAARDAIQAAQVALRAKWAARLAQGAS